MSDHRRAAHAVHVASLGPRGSIFEDHLDSLGDDRGWDPMDLRYYLNGWRLHRGSAFPYTGDLAPESYHGPNGELVHVLNTHEYSTVGEHDWAAFGANRGHVQVFLQAFGFEGIPIKGIALVYQTL